MDEKIKSELYFLALMPPVSLAQKIHLLKKQIAEKYNSSHSLKVPEHITVIPPFRCNETELEIIINGVSNKITRNPFFEITLKNFGHFNSKVIFINAFSVPENALSELYLSLKKIFEEQFSFLKNLELKEEYHPHLTVANRDLKPSSFRKAWNDFKLREFEESFTVKSLYLLRHDEKIWKPFREMAF